MTGSRFHVQRRCSFISNRGSALIIVLGFVVLLTILIVAFLSQATISRQIFNARAGQTEVDVLGNSAVQFMKADFRQEILSGSTVYYGTTNSGVPGSPIYIPLTNATIVPSRTGFSPGSTATADPYANIVKISKYQTNFFSGASSAYNTSSYPSPNYASQVSTAASSLNGRYIDSTNGWTTNGWGKPELIDSSNYPTAMANAPLPDWVYVTTSGRKVLTAPEGDVVGRYSYVVYDEGGLLDINSAGYNSALSTADAYDVARKGSLGLADLTQIPGITTTIRDALVSWRNHTTSSSSYTANTNAYPPTTTPATVTPFLQYLLDGNLNSGFLKTYPGDQKFLSRQDLLAYQTAGSSGLTTQSLAYLGTFSRTINAPTWTPIDSPGETFSPSTTYAANAEDLYWPASLVGSSIEPVYNRDVPNVRWPADTTITRPKLDDDTGTLTETVTFHKGDPVLQHRFPLSKLQLLSKLVANPTAAGVVAIGQKPAQGTIAWAVLYYFGLEWDTTGNPNQGNSTDTPYVATQYEPHWEYVHCRNFLSGDGGGGSGYKYIASIAQVASGVADYENTLGGKTFPNGREPDFFELLQAGMLRGSTSSSNIFDVGVSAIDQTTSTDIPSLLTVEGNVRQYIGRKSLPYFCQMLFWPYRPKYDTTRSTIEAYLVPVLWNPHRNATTASTTVTGYRMYLFFSHANQVMGQLGTASGGFAGVNSSTGIPYCNTTPYYQYSTANDPEVTPSFALSSSNSNYVLTFKTSTDYAEPTILSSTYVTSPAPIDPNNANSPVGGLTETPNTRWGFFLGSAYIPDASIASRLGTVLPAVPWAPATPTTWPSTTQMSLVGATGQSGAGLWYRLQCQDTSGNWHTYTETAHGALGSGDGISAVAATGAKVNYSGTGGNASPSFSGVTLGADAYDYFGSESFGPLDPRINHAAYSTIPNRAGTGSAWIAGLGGSVSVPTGSTLRPFPDTSTRQTQMGDKYSGNASSSSLNFGLPDPPAFTPVADYSEMIGENSATLAAPSSGYNTYADDGNGGIIPGVLTGDGVMRPGDGYYGAYPMATVANGGKASGSDRPLILNRPFLSVGELGYTFRSVEWKTLDFSTVYSGDSGLLDLFSINDTEGADQQSMISGVTSLNTHNPSVLQALISGGLINGLDSTGTGITGADAQTMANAIVAETSGQGTGLKAGPLLNRAQLATRVVPLPDIATALATDGYVTKDRREAVVRALAEPADTRTWNLMIDLVVQAGRYPPNAIAAGTSAALANFDVQGERHYWLHLAIDRYTGKVIDEQLEVVRDN